MMRLVIALLLVVGLACAVASLELIPFRPPTVTTACDVEYCENFEATGAPTSWTTGNYDNTSSPIAGAQDLKLTPTQVAIYDPNYNAAQRWWTWTFKFDDPLEANEIVFQVNSTAALMASLTLRPITNADWSCAIAGGAAANVGGSVAGYNTTGITLKATYKQGSGGNAEFRVWKWNGSSWDVQCENTDGTATTTIDNIRWPDNANGTTLTTGLEHLQIDNFKSHTLDITSPAM